MKKRREVKTQSKKILTSKPRSKLQLMIAEHLKQTCQLAVMTEAAAKIAAIVQEELILISNK